MTDSTQLANHQEIGEVVDTKKYYLAMMKAQLNVARYRLSVVVGPGTMAALERDCLIAEESLLMARIAKQELDMQHVSNVNLNDYTGDNYPRAGCTLVIRLTEKGWCMDVFAPGYAPGGNAGLIESYFPRPHGSTGLAVDSFIQHGSDWRSRIPAMVRAENDYSSGSAVTL